MKGKKKEYGLEMIVMSVSLVAMFFIFFAMMMADMTDTRKFIGTSGLITQVIDDGEITSEEMYSLKQLSCNDLKMLLGTGKEVCIYFKNAQGDVVDISGDGRFGIGCPGLEVDGTRICNQG